jgi:hypothetical protein
VRNYIAVFLLLLISAKAESLELKIPFEVVQDEVVRRLFVNGRSYLSGDPSSACEYSYLENPRIFPQGDRLAFQAMFRGSTGKEVLNRCLGVDASFEVVITGTPIYQDGVLRFDDPELKIQKSRADKLFETLLNQFADDLEEDLAIPLETDVQQLSRTLNQAVTDYQLEIRRFSVSSIDVLPDGLLLLIDAKIEVAKGR